MESNKIYNEDCLSFIPKMEDHSIEVVVTSPPYNTSKKSSQEEIEKKRQKGKLEKGFRQHKKLINYCNNLKGKVLINKYDRPIYDELKGFNKIQFESPNAHSNGI